MTTKKQTAQAEAAAELRKLIKPGDRVYCILRHRASSGMFRVIDLLIPVREYRSDYPKKPAELASYPGESDFDAKPKRVFVGTRIRSIGYLAAAAMDRRWDSDRGGIAARGAGMDMGFDLVYNLGRAMYPNGVNCAGEKRCQSNDHVNPGADRNNYDRRHKHSDSGYAFKAEWL
jgi:hypothetical protein